MLMRSVVQLQVYACGHYVEVGLTDFILVDYPIHRGFYMSAHVLLNLLNELGKSDKMRGLPSILLYNY